MCGIVGFITKDNLENKLINTLKLLEYRGYDSAGIAVILNNEIKTTKSEGQIKNLEKIVESSFSTCGIAHTRWATTGEPTIKNAHPHLSQNKNYAVVHNGIIENYEKLKKDLIKKNINFASDTDTEVIAQMLECSKQKESIFALIETCKKLEGSFALAVLNKNENNTLFLARKKSPLYIAKLKNEIITASDPICFASFTKFYYALNDDEFCRANLETVEFYNLKGEKVTKKLQKLENLQIDSIKNLDNHFMLKEIKETKLAIKRIAENYKLLNFFNVFDSKFIKKYKKIVLVGCGTAYHACLMGVEFLEKFAKIDSKAYVASEFRYCNPLIDKNTLCIFVSQSGETLDTILSQELAKKLGAYTITLTNVLYSTLAKNCNYVLPVFAGPEIAVASTKAYTAQITILYMLSKFLENIKYNRKYEIYENILNLSKKLKFFNEENFKELVEEIKNEKQIFFIGKLNDYITSLEASLKFKETTYINSSCYPSGELKHGFLAMIEQSSYVFSLITNKEMINKTLNASLEAQCRGAKIVLITPFSLQKEKLKNIYKVFKLQNFDEELMPITSIIFFQLLSYYTSISKNINPDKPRNLAKSVTVE